LATTARMQHSRRMEKYGRSIHSNNRSGPGTPMVGSPMGQVPPFAMRASVRSAADPAGAGPPSPAVSRPRQFQNEEAFFSELRTHLWHTDKELEKYRGLLEKAMSTVLDAKNTVPVSSDSASPWQQGYSMRCTRGGVDVARDRVSSLVAPIVADADAKAPEGEALARRKKHMETQLRHSRAVLSAHMECEALKQAQALNMNADAWEGANNMLSSLVSVLLPHLDQLQAIPSDRRTPSENTAVQVLSSAASGSH